MRYEGLARSEYTKEGISYEMQMVLLAQTQAESAWLPRGTPNSAGASGITQFIPSTARRYGVVYGTSDAAIATQFRGQAKYMKFLLNRYNGNKQLALMAYNWGEGNVDRYVRGQTKGWMPQETRGYINKISRTIQYYR